MIKSVKITPLYEKCNQVKEFGIYIECSIKDANEISNLIDFLQNMTDCPIESGESET